jgi:uncharacterized protein YdaU (DUF1376 family)
MANKYPYLPFYGDDFYSDSKVENMNLEQEAIYVRMLWAAWKQDIAGSLPSDEKVLVKILRITKAQWLRNKDMVLAPFYFADDGRWHQKRSESECSKAANRSEVARKKAEKRWHRSDAGALQAQHKPSICPAYARASGSSSLSLEEKEEEGMQGEKKNGNHSFSFGPDPNTYVPPRKIRYIDRKNPPFPPIDFWQNETLQKAMRHYLGHVEEKHGWTLMEREFNSLCADLEREFSSAIAIENAILKTVKKGWKHIPVPSETGANR